MALAVAAFVAESMVTPAVDLAAVQWLGGHSPNSTMSSAGPVGHSSVALVIEVQNPAGTGWPAWLHCYLDHCWHCQLLALVVLLSSQWPRLWQGKASHCLAFDDCVVEMAAATEECAAPTGVVPSRPDCRHCCLVAAPGVVKAVEAAAQLALVGVAVEAVAVGPRAVPQAMLKTEATL